MVHHINAQKLKLRKITKNSLSLLSRPSSIYRGIGTTNLAYSISLSRTKWWWQNLIRTAQLEDEFKPHKNMPTSEDLFWNIRSRSIDLFCLENFDRSNVDRSLYVRLVNRSINFSSKEISIDRL
jgi:hypothetical protein